MEILMAPGHVYVNLKVIGTKANHNLESILIDTGSTYTYFPKDFLEEVGAIPIPGDAVKLELANNNVIDAVPYALMLQIGNRKGPIIAVTFEGASSVVGVQTLEALGLKVNPVTEKLEETRAPGLAYL